MPIILAGAATTAPTKDLLAIFGACKVGPKFVEYCASACIEDVLALALCAPSQERFDELVCKEAEILDLPRERNEAWYLACEARDERKASATCGSAAVDDDQPLAIGVLEHLRDAWHDRYRFHPGGCRLLADGAFNRVHRGLRKEPRKLQVVLLTSVRTMASLGDDSSQLRGLLVSTRGGVKETVLTHSLVHSTHDLWMRMRIVTFTICYCMVEVDGFFPLEDQECLMEYLNELMFHRLDQVEPDLPFFNGAWIRTMNDWGKLLRTETTTLKSLVDANTSWTHFWTNYNPSTDFGSRLRASSPDSPMDTSRLPADLVAKVEATYALARSLQSTRDSERSTANNLKRENFALEDGSAEEEKGTKKRGDRGDKKPWKKLKLKPGNGADARK